MKKDDIYKATRVSKELVELIDLNNLIISEKNYRSLMKQIGFTDNEVNNLIQENPNKINENYIVPHCIYKHKNNTDVAFYVVSVGFTDSEVICDGYWMNVVNAKRFYAIDRENIIIKSDDIQNWEEIKEVYQVSFNGSNK